ncbi:MAG: type II toxin-antitoxin system prevent-host-death family antitoxin [Propionibacteriaceae bacterium]|nr:type II toxin-antitoxin system prevent-host-death family antitoxin [Propionibacteriaceae bacterium]
MVTVAVRDLRNNTSQVVQRVRAGEDVILTSRGEQVARIVPVDTGRRPFLTPEEVMAIPKTDPGLRADLAALDEDASDLGPIL